MWKATTVRSVSKPVTTLPVKNNDNNNDDDEWETDADFVNDVSEREQRWGAKTVQGSGRLDAVDIDKLRDNVKKDSELIKKKEYEESEMKPSVGYGGKFGVQKDRVDKSAVGFEYHVDLEKHASQKDYSQGFGGKFGVLNDRKDASAVGFEHVENLSKHSSQLDYSKGFGGKYGVNSDRKDASAVGFDHVEAVPKHSSQLDYSKGFGGKYGVNTDRKDASAVGFDHVETLQKHSSQLDYSKGFGGKFGVEKTMDKNACKFEDEENHVVGTNYQRTRADSKTDIKDIKSKFEKNVFTNNDESKRRAEEIRAERLNKEKQEKELEKIHIENRNGDSNNNNHNNNQGEIIKPKIGKININSAFLGAQQQKNEIIKSKPEPSKTNKNNLVFNRFNLNNNKNETSITKTNGNSNESKDVLTEHKVDEKPIVIEEKINDTESKPIELYENEQNIDNNKANNSNISASPPSQTPIPVSIPMPQPTIYNNNNDNNDEDDSNVDDWNDDDTPVKIQPTYIAKIEDYQEEYTNINDGNDFYENANNQPKQQQEQQLVNNKRNIKAIALYDFVASEPDELSFDPNDIIENIQMLDEGWWQGTTKGRFGLFPSNYVELLND